MNDFEPGELLLVEDSSTDAEMTQRALRKVILGNTIQWVRDGAEAMDFIFCAGVYASRHAHPNPRLMLLDLKMPKISGIDVLRVIKTDERTRSIPVVIMTSSAEDRDIAECYRLGVNSYIVKPVESASFIDVVGRLGLYWMLTNTTMR